MKSELDFDDLWTAALFHNHFGQVTFDYVQVRAEIDEGHGGEFGGGTTWSDPTQVTVSPPILLNHMSMIVEKGVRGSMRPTAVTPTVIGMVAPWCNDPVIPSQLPKVNVEPLFAAVFDPRRALHGSTA